MCTFLYGNVNEEAYEELFLRISKKHGYAQDGAFRKKDVFSACDIEDGAFFRITSGHCDCNNPVGRGDPDSKILDAYIDWLRELRKCRKLKRFRFINCWDPDVEQRPGRSTSLYNLNQEFLSGIEENTYGCIDYTKRWDDSENPDYQ